MTPQQIESFVRSPRIADLATVRPDGSPHVAPVWYLLDGENYLVMASKTAVKIRNIRHDPRVSLSIATDAEPYEYVIVDGKAEISYGDTRELLDTISIHYKGEQEGKVYAEEAARQIDFCVITIRPTRVKSWSA